MRGRGQIIPRGVDDQGQNVWLLRVFIGRDAARKRKYRNVLFVGTKTAAGRKLDALHTARNTGALAAETRQTVDEWLDEWLAGTKHEVGPRTYADYKASLTRYVRPALGVMRLSRLSSGDIQALVNDMADERKLAPHTIRLTLVPLGAALAEAVRRGMLVKSPFDNVKRPGIRRVERRVLGPTEATKLLAVCDSDDRWGPLITVLLMTGVRPGELCALKWADVDGATLRVQRALVQTEDGPVLDDNVKTALSRRAIALSDVELRALARQRRRVAALKLAAGPEWLDNDLIFPTATGRPHDSRNISRRVLPRLLGRAKLPAMRLYDARHSCATLLLAAGVNPKIVSARLGHSTVAMTLNTYSHILPSMQQEAADTLARLVTVQPVQASG
jgi:integrase